MGFKKPNTSVTQYVEKPGWFHVAVTRADENPVFDGEVKDRVDIGIVVLAGTEPSQVKRETKLGLNNPNEGNKDGGEFLSRVQCRFAASCDIMAIITNENGERQYCPVNEVPEGADMEIDWVGQEHRENPDAVQPWIVGKQLIVKLHEETFTNRNGQTQKSIKLDGAHAYHVTDPDVAHVPKNHDALKLGGYKVAPPPSDKPAPAKGADKPPAEKPAAAGAKTVANAPAKTSPAKPAGKAPANGAKPAAAGAYDDL